MVGVTSSWDHVKSSYPSGPPFPTPRSRLTQWEGMTKGHHNPEN